MRLLSLLLISLWSYSVSAAVVESSAVDIALTARYFINEAGQAGNTDLYRHALGAEIKTDTKGRLGDINWRLAAYGAYDTEDTDRRYADLREANLSYHWQNYSLAAGVMRTFWGVSESINVVNVINQSDLRLNINGKEKMGQQQVSFLHMLDTSEIQLIYMPQFTEQNFAQRPDFGLPVSETARYENGQREGGWAARYKHFSDNAEWALGYFSGTRRNPVLTLSESAQTLVPLYLQTENVLFDGVFLGEFFNPKLELKLGRELGDRYVSTNIGVEFQHYPDFGQLHELTFIIEYLRDTRGADAETIGQQDVFVGVKGVVGTGAEFRLLVGHDLDTHGQYFELSGQYRLTDFMRITAQAVGGIDVDRRDRLLFPLDNDKYVTVKLHYAF